MEVFRRLDNAPLADQMGQNEPFNLYNENIIGLKDVD